MLLSLKNQTMLIFQMQKYCIVILLFLNYVEKFYMNFKKHYLIHRILEPNHLILTGFYWWYIPKPLLLNMSNIALLPLQ